MKQLWPMFFKEWARQAFGIFAAMMALAVMLWLFLSFVTWGWYPVIEAWLVVRVLLGSAVLVSLPSAFMDTF